MRKQSKYAVRSRLLPIVLLLSMIGCAPVISKQVREQVDPAITPEEVLSNPEQYSGEMIILSGEIIETKIDKEDTLIVVLQRPAGFRGRPKDAGTSAGRFLALVDHYLDPFIYRQGREITIGGRIEGTRALPLGETQYVYPVIHVEDLYLWPIERDYYRPYPSFHIGLGFGYFF
ncbi:MAG: hypothetical protein E3K32_13505 [wastewater metagenome]|nr:hypothetical protein [Candidatus Loosdrechtia aerotolerans]